jgi:hypothetical protein
MKIKILYWEVKLLLYKYNFNLLIRYLLDACAVKSKCPYKRLGDCAVILKHGEFMDNATCVINEKFKEDMDRKWKENEKILHSSISPRRATGKTARNT